MNLYPAIDLKDGACVRLLYGDMSQATIYNHDPSAQAKHFAGAGCKWLHVVDLDGAVSGAGVNHQAILDIIKAGVAVQLGGGVRSMATIEYWLGEGVSRIILGTAALKNPMLVIEAARAFPDRIGVAADAKDGMVAVEGWVESSEMTALELAYRFENCGVTAMIFTDIGRDGARGGLNLEATVALARNTSIPIIASGGVASMADIDALVSWAGAVNVAQAVPTPWIEAPVSQTQVSQTQVSQTQVSQTQVSQTQGQIDGVIIGRAIYEGQIDIATALAALESA